MGDLISRLELQTEFEIECVGECGCCKHITYKPDGCALIDNAPTVDAEPVRHGRWISVKNPNWPAYSHDKCSICGWWNTKNAMCYDGSKKPGHSLNYCPNCGAKMQGGKDDENT